MLCDAICLVWPLQVALSLSDSESAAQVKAKMERVVLSQVAAHIKAMLPEAGCISIRLDPAAVAWLELPVTPRSVALALLNNARLKLKKEHIR